MNVMPNQAVLPDARGLNCAGQWHEAVQASRFGRADHLKDENSVHLRFEPA